MSPSRADSVAKVGEELPANKKSQESNRAERILNQRCALAPDLESMLRARMCKILLQQNRPIADITWAFNHRANRGDSSACRSDLIPGHLQGYAARARPLFLLQVYR